MVRFFWWYLSSCIQELYLATCTIKLQLLPTAGSLKQRHERKIHIKAGPRGRGGGRRGKGWARDSSLFLSALLVHYYGFHFF